MSDHLTVKASAGKEASPQASKGEEVYYLVFTLLLNSMLIRQETVGVEAKDLNIFSDSQVDIDKEIGNLKYAELPSGNVTQEEISEVETFNLHVSNEKQRLNSLLMGARQGSQLEYAQANSNVTMTLQDSAEESAYMGTLGVVFKLINSIIKSN